MKEVELSKQTKMSKWYKFFWCKADYEMPRDTCTYYRNCIFSFLLIPFTFFGMILHKTNNNICESVGGRVWLTIAFFVLPLLGGFFWFSKEEIDSVHILIFWLWGWLSVIIGLIGLTILILIGFGIDYLVEKHKEKKAEKARLAQPILVEAKPKEPNVFVAWYKNLKEKRCSKIKWVD